MSEFDEYLPEFEEYLPEFDEPYPGADGGADHNGHAVPEPLHPSTGSCSVPTMPKPNGSNSTDG